MPDYSLAACPALSPGELTAFLFPQEKASKWHNQHKDVDGLTTNGVLLLHPRGRFSESSCQPGNTPSPLTLLSQVIPLSF